MDKIRVLVANRPRLMRELVLATISDQPDIEIMGEVKHDSEIAQVAAEAQPDFVIIALDTPARRPEICETLFRRNPEVKVLALAPEHNSSVLFWSRLDIQAQQVESSEAGILSALRGKTAAVSQ